MHKTLQPQGWARPIGYANGVEARGRTVFIGGQIGWNEQQQFETDDFVEQTEQTLKNIVAILAEAGGRPEHIASMTWYFTDKAEYNANLKGIGRAYRDVIGKHFPAMAAVQVVALVEDRAKIEIQAFAVIPD
ncbi:RidA family protein [Ochrobactrum pecoris]|uniref:Enamine deaminase RidA (YjgF/YER057c/UK114 family) n=1 Tax=Brucella pecoris TaxID=867683 RepID=A0A5C5CWU6_9HYPH|nr:RidA family protein [Brucella pecoris]MBB4091927.1 enamine deaminase RidA (YjgF/YER057c/UK114 family) [Brucella pecoris]NKW82265.1 RidA family protein [Brucella pecoris]TNV15617.1 RidA family protein [Brucella pecoris]